MVVLLQPKIECGISTIWITENYMDEYRFLAEMKKTRFVILEELMSIYATMTWRNNLNNSKRKRKNALSFRIYKQVMVDVCVCVCGEGFGVLANRPRADSITASIIRWLKWNWHICYLLTGRSCDWTTTSIQGWTIHEYLQCLEFFFIDVDTVYTYGRVITIKFINKVPGRSKKNRWIITCS